MFSIFRLATKYPMWPEMPWSWGTMSGSLTSTKKEGGKFGWAKSNYADFQQRTVILLFKLLQRVVPGALIMVTIGFLTTYIIASSGAFCRNSRQVNACICVENCGEKHQKGKWKGFNWICGCTFKPTCEENLRGHPFFQCKLFWGGFQLFNCSLWRFSIYKFIGLVVGFVGQLSPCPQYH